MDAILLLPFAPLLLVAYLWAPDALRAPFARKRFRKIAALIDNDPDAWAFEWAGSSIIRHRSGLKVWVGNGASGVHVELPDGHRMLDRVRVPASPDQAVIWRAAKRWRRPRDLARAAADGAWLDGVLGND